MVSAEVEAERHRWLNLVAAIACVTVFGFALGNMFPLLSLIMESRGIDNTTIGINTAMQPLGIVLSGFVVPPLVARFGAKWVVITAAFIAALIVVAYPFLPMFYAWFVLRFLQGLAVSTLFSVSESWVVRFADGPYRTRIVAIYASVLALSFGLGASVVAVTGIEGFFPFAVSAAVLVAAILPVFMIQESSSKSEASEAGNFLTFVPKAPVLLLSVFVFSIFDAAFLGFLSVYGVKKGMTQSEAALLLSVLSFGNVGLQIPIGWLGDKYPKRLVMTWCVVATLLFTLLIPISVGTPWLWPVLMIVGATSVGIYTIALGEIGERFSGPELVAGTSAMATMWGTGAIIGALLTGWAMQAFGPDGFPYAQAVVLAIFLGIIWWRERTRRSQPATAT